MKTGYQTDLAHIHDVAFTDFVRVAAPWLLRTLRSNGIRDGLVVDLGCGSGRWAAALLRAGYDVEGIDLSRSMIALAKRRAPKATFRVASLLTAKIPKCAAVTSIGECVNYAFDRRNSDAALKKLFQRVFESLSPGGLFIFDAAEPGLADARKWMESEAEGWAILLEVTAQPSKRRAVRRMTIFRRVSGSYRRTEEQHPMRLYSRAELRAMLERAGFSVRIVRGYGKTRFRPGLIGFVCSKRTRPAT